MRLCKFFVIIFFLIIPIAGTATLESPFFISSSTSIIGKSNTGVASSRADAFLLNPASVALTDSLFFSANYGSLDNTFILPSLMSAIPFSYGVLAMSFSYFSKDSDLNKISGYYFSAGFGKEINSRLTSGIALDISSMDAGDNFYYGSLRPGFLYFFGSRPFGGGFGLYDFSAGISANIGFSSSDELSYNSLKGGIEFVFYRDSQWELSLAQDASYFMQEANFSYSTGIEALILNTYYLRCGIAYPNSYYLLSYSLGAGYKIDKSFFSGVINYSLVHSDLGYDHFLGLSFRLEGEDRNPPVTSIEPDIFYISPNFDGVNDYLIFKTEVSDASSIAGWKLQIVDGNDNVVREYSITERDMESELTLKTFITRFISKKESLVVPEKILWDGSDRSGKKLPDGEYKFYFFAWDSKDNISPVKSGYVYIDNTAPSVSVKVDSLIFSPNGDRKKDTLIIHQDIITSEEDIWIGEIKDISGKTVFSRQWQGRDVPKKFEWGGSDLNGNLLPDGLYYYTITSTDKAGNATRAEIQEIILTTAMETVDVRGESFYFSYKSGKSSIRFFPEVSSRKGIEKWELLIYSDEDKPLRVITGQEIPGFIDWDCTDQKGKTLDDGVYFYKLIVTYVSGNAPSSFPKKLIFDSTPPVVKISHAPDLFSPDGDGENDYLTFRITSKEEFNISSWEIAIYSETGVLFKKMAGSGTPPETLNWDGLGDNGELVESASDYQARITCKDMAGNVSETAFDKISVDVLVMVTERGLKMRISNIEFAFDSALLKKRGIQILDRVYQILEKYNSYEIIIEGHTDDVGAEEYNLSLSEKRAKAVRDYLVKKGTNPERLKFIGMGETMPFYPNTNDENRRRNRRVEFLLVKKKYE